MGSMGVPIIMQSIVGNARLRGNYLPELFDVLKGLAGCIAREQVCLGSRAGEGKMLSALLLRVMRGLYPNSTLKINVRPAGLQDFTNPCAGQNLKANGICGALVRMGL